MDTLQKELSNVMNLLLKHLLKRLVIERANQHVHIMVVFL